MNDLATGAAWVLGGVALLAWLTLLVAPLLSGGRPLLVATLPADGPEALPRLSIVVPALNEEETVEPAMRTLLALDYPQLEIIAVDDRSTDETGGILDRLAATDPRLRVLHVRELPAGWLGKNHALHLASREATGDYILFTDADVLFEPTVLRRTVRAMIARGLDHLAVFPELVRGGFWETLCVWFFGALL